MERTVEASSSLQQEDFFLCKIIYSLREHLMLAFAHFSLSSASNLMDHVPLPHPPVVSLGKLIKAWGQPQCYQHTQRSRSSTNMVRKKPFPINLQP